MISSNLRNASWHLLDASQRSQYRREYERRGFIVVRQLVHGEFLAELHSTALQELSGMQGSIEFEADLGYPGAPSNRDVEGGCTPRRLLQAYHRHEIFQMFTLDPNLHKHVRLCTNRNKLVLSPNHHNCIMTKYPGYSSSTYWHQDIRYWHFDKPELVTVWLALTDETAQNGALKVIPGSHNLSTADYDLDEMSFLRPETQRNQELLEQSHQVTLSAGDALFFHCRLFHGANQNVSKQTKLSLVFSFHTDDNQPISGTRSTLQTEIALE